MIYRKYVDPITGGYSENPVMRTDFTYNTIHFVDNGSPDIVLEYSLDDDIKSLVMNLMLPKMPDQKRDELNRFLFKYLTALLPESLNIGVETTEQGITIILPDFSGYPLLQTEKLAEALLAKALGAMARYKPSQPN